MGKILIYVAMDVHGKSIVSCAVKGQSDMVLEDRFPNDESSIRRHLRKLSKRGEVRVCYEASSCGYVLYNKIRSWGYRCDVIAPSKVPKSPGDRVKTDRRDAKQLVLLYRGGLLSCVGVPTPLLEGDRALIRLRFQKQRDVHRLRQRILKFLRLRGYVYGGRNWTDPHRKWFKGLHLSERDRYILDEYLCSMEYEESRLYEIDREIVHLSREPRYRDVVDKLRCFRGIDTLSAMVLLTEMGDITRFGSAPALMSYCGLVPSEHSSGEKRRQGGTGYGGNRHLRYILVEAAWHYRHRPMIGKRMGKRMKGQPPEMFSYSMNVQRYLHKRFWKLAARKSSQEAAVAVARLLVGFIWDLMVKESPDAPEAVKREVI
jgi:transposase